MSVLGAFLPYQPQSVRPVAATSADTGTAARQGSGGQAERALVTTGTSTGATAAEQSVTVSQVAPVLASRTNNTTSSVRSGADGRTEGNATATEADVAQVKGRSESPQDVEARAQAVDDAAQKRLVTQEILARIPVPVEAIPSLTDEAEKATEAKGSGMLLNQMN